MAYEYPTETNTIGSFTGLLQYVNSVTNGLFITMISIALFIILLITYYNARKSYGEAFAVSGFITSIVTFFFVLADLIPIPFFAGFLVTTIVAVGFLFMNNRN